MRPFPLPSLIVLAACLRVPAEDTARPLDGRAYAIDVAAGGDAPARRATLVFAGAASRLDYGDDASLPFSYEAHVDGDAIAFAGAFTAGGATLRGTALGEAVKGELIAADVARPFSGSLSREAAVLLERGRERQLQRRPQEAIDLYAQVIERHRSELAYSAPALVYLVECFQSLIGDAPSEARWRELSTRYLSAPPPLDGTATITIEQAKQDLLLKSWTPAPPPADALAKQTTTVAPDGTTVTTTDDGRTVHVEMKHGVSNHLSVHFGGKDVTISTNDGDAADAADGRNAKKPIADGWRWWIGALADGGTTKRLDEALIRTRDGAPLDGDAWAAVRRLSHPRIGGRTLARSQALILTGGTDDLAVEPGEGLASLTYVDGASLADDGIYQLSATGARSSERGWIADVSLNAWAAHLGYQHDDFGPSYRVGFAAPGGIVEDLSGDDVRGSIGIDRIIDEKTGERRLSTEVYAHLWIPVSDGIMVYASGSYCRSARRDDGEPMGAWTGTIGLAWNLDHAF